MTTSIEVAAYGWQGAAWDGFYPENMPAEWRLDYYANEFFAVVVPFGEWSQADDETVLEWLEQVSADFRFYWEVSGSDAAATARLQALLQDEAFAAHWGGAVELNGPALRAQSPFSDDAFALLYVPQNLALRPLRGEMEQGLALGGSRLLLVVGAEASSTLHPARDLALLLGS